MLPSEAWGVACMWRRVWRWQAMVMAGDYAQVDCTCAPPPPPPQTRAESYPHPNPRQLSLCGYHAPIRVMLQSPSESLETRWASGPRTILVGRCWWAGGSKRAAGVRVRDESTFTPHMGRWIQAGVWGSLAEHCKQLWIQAGRRGAAHPPARLAVPCCCSAQGAVGQDSDWVGQDSDWVGQDSDWVGQD